MASMPVIPVVILGTGAYLAWFAVHYWGSDTKWPTDPLKDVLQGKSLPVPSGQTTAAGVAQNVESSTLTAVVPGAAGNSAPAVAGGTYDRASLMTLWTANGGSQSTASDAAYVALAESGGRSTVTSSNPDGGTNVGLWQLDTKGVGLGYTVAQLQNPDTNAKITIMHTANGTIWAEWADPVISHGVYIGPKT